MRVDRDWFDEVRRQNGVDAGTLEFPRYATERRFALTGAQVAIGRRNPPRGTAPDLDLTGLDPGVSAAHAVLVARPDGGWEVVDVGSTNGTTLALADGPIPATARPAGRRRRDPPGRLDHDHPHHHALTRESAPVRPPHRRRSGGAVARTPSRQSR